MLINYQEDAELFSNSAILCISLLEDLASSIEDECFSPEDLLRMSIIAESIVFNSDLVFRDENYWLDYEMIDDYGLLPFSREIIDNFYHDKPVLRSHHTLYNSISHEIAILTTPRDSLKIKFIHNSCISIEYHSDVDDYEELFEPFLTRLYKTFDKAYTSKFLETADHYNLFGEPVSDLPWKMLADCHGIPYISSALYTLDNLSYTNIGLDLYHKLESFHKSFFNDLRKYLGCTYVQIPPILSILLNEMKSIEEFPQIVIQLRQRFKKFRDECYQIELEMRKANTIFEQLKLVKDLEYCYNSIASKFKTVDTRIINRLFDIAKAGAPLSMVVEALSIGGESLIEGQGLLKVSGYYDLWKDSFKVNQGLSNLRRVFGSSINNSFIEQYNKLLLSINAQKPIDTIL